MEANKRTEDVKLEYSRREAESHTRYSEIRASYESELQDVKEQLTATKSKQKTSLIGILFIIICCLIRNRMFIYDLWDFIKIPALWIKDKFILYLGWMKTPYYTNSNTIIPFSSGWAWTFRIITPIVILVILLGIVLGLFLLIQYYKKRWCNLSLKVVIGSLAILTVFGDLIRQYIPINLVILFLLVQILFLLVRKIFNREYKV